MDLVIAFFSGGSFVVVIVGLILAFSRKYFDAYVVKKGSNQADKEDIEKLTRLVEEVKSKFAADLAALNHQYATTIEAKKVSSQLRMTALDRRLQAHQDAFALWRKLLKACHTPSVHTVVSECETWWESHCLYLEPPARQAFATAFWCAGQHSSLLNSGRGVPGAAQDIAANWKSITDTAAIIEASVALPPMVETALDKYLEAPGDPKS